jgi:CRISPR-associated endonuclease/helicase Cas3
MLVTFISQCEKKALARTRRVLDAFADRIGSNTWQTVITEDGLIAVKNLLRKTATKNTAVACHWARSRSRSDLVWIVGNRNKFNREGIVPVNTTQRNVMSAEWENNWTYLPLIKSLVAISALLHDWGKATLLFQNKLKPPLKAQKNLGDPLRHEWISCILLEAIVIQSGDIENDDAWLNVLVSGKFNEAAIQDLINEKSQYLNKNKPLANLPPIASLVAWLILTHHRLPLMSNTDDFKDVERNDIKSLLKSITSEWGYQNKYDEADFAKRVKECFVFPQGFISQSKTWMKQVQKWSARLLHEQPQAKVLIANGAWRVALHHARLCLMLGDHYYSSCDADPKWQSPLTLYANTDKNRQLKQKLDEHLVNVSANALRVAQMLSRFTTDMEVATDVLALKRKSPQGYEWQDTAVSNITAFRKQHEQSEEKGYGCFIVNMASTGCGKTFANAKIMRALSTDAQSLRYVLALGLRTLTLQTGDEYRERIGLDNSELAVLIGSAAVKELHDKKRANLVEEEPSFESQGSESEESLLDEDVNYDGAITVDFLDAVIRQDKDKAFLYAPVLACTIDHLMAATETTRGGRYILPCLRLLSSDLVIDEVDDFDGQDLIAIGRLIHMAGMLGRKVMISSATIAPALAEGFFNSYQEGWLLHSQFRSAHPKVACVWVDEFTTQISFVVADNAAERCQVYEKQHQKFIVSRIQSLSTQVAKRKGVIVDCADLYDRDYDASLNEGGTLEQSYFEKIKQSAISLHQQHHTLDAITGKRVSFGVVRVANIPPCIALSQYLMQSEWQSGFTAKVMAYHSRQVLLLRHEQEQHLDAVLKRKEKQGEPPKAFNNSVIRSHLNNTTDMDVLFILVATPVEEVGRDHDFDWAVVEPSSYRSIIQLSGRVRRHRIAEVIQPNVALMQYNLKALRRDGKPAYCRPGYENEKRLKLESHDLTKLVDSSKIAESINAIPRIDQPALLTPHSSLSDLEHQSLIFALKSYAKKGPETLQAWLSSCWWMTALPQVLNRFRESEPTIKMYLIWNNNKLVFCERNDAGDFIEREKMYGIIQDKSTPTKGLWLNRNYHHTLLQNIDSQVLTETEVAQMIRRDSKRYGEINFPARDKDKQFSYSDQFGLILVKTL